MQQDRKASLLRRIGRILLIFAALLLLGYGLLMLTLGFVQQSEIRKAKAKGTAVTVHITELEHTVPDNGTFIVVVEPADKSPDIPRGIGKTFATTDNRNLAVGDTLTMYYDPADPTDRTGDFGTAAPRIRMGCVLTGLGAALLTVFIIIRLRMRKNGAAVTQ